MKRDFPHPIAGSCGQDLFETLTMDHTPFRHTLKSLSPALRGWMVIALLACHGLLAVTSVLDKSATFDETIHVTSGYSYWIRNDYRLQPENGNLPQRWVALPLLCTSPVFPEAGQNVWATAHAFFYRTGNDADQMLFHARLMVICLSLVLAIAVYRWSASLFGPLGGLVALGLYCFSPTLLAHGRLTTSDMAVTLFFILAVRNLWALLHQLTVKRFVGASLAVAGLLLSKMSAVLIVPISAGLVGARLFWGGGRPLMIGRSRRIETRTGQGAVFLVTALVVAAVCVGAIWGAYGFRFSADPALAGGQALSFPLWAQELPNSGWIAPGVAFFRDNQLLPEAYLYGLTYALSQAKARWAFLCGDFSLTGWWYFFPFAMAVKTPLSTWLMVLLGIGGLVRAGISRFGYALAPLFCLAVVYGGASLSAHINIGHRHVLPFYPVLFILAGASALWVPGHRRAAVLLGPLIALVFLTETLVIWPHYLAFFNVAAGGPSRGYRLLVDSSLDWGQDLPGLARWIENRRGLEKERRPVYLAYFGTASPVYHGIPARIFADDRLSWAGDVTAYADALGPGYYCISATILQQVYGIRKPWGRAEEEAYWFSRGVARQYRTAQSDPDRLQEFFDRQGSRNRVARILRQFETLRLARLCHHLKQRPPDAHVGYSILIYKVSSQALKHALLDPMAM